MDTSPDPFSGAPEPEFSQEHKDKRRGKKAGIITAAALLVLGGAYAGAAWYVSDHVPKGTTVVGVDISGMSRDDAISTLDDGLAEKLSAEIEVELEKTQAVLDPAEAGLGIDIPATVDELLGFTLDPVTLYNHFFGRGEHAPVLDTTPDDLISALEAAAAGLDVEPVEGEFELVEGKVEETDPVDGHAVDIEAAADVVLEQWLEDARPIVLPHVTLPPEMDEAAMERVRQTVITPLFSGGVKLTVNEESAEVPGDVIVNAASLQPNGTTYDVVLEQKPIGKSVKELFPDLGESPVDARFEFRDGKPHIVPSITGAGINVAEVTEGLARAAVRSGEERSVAIELETTEPDFTTQDAKDLKVNERVVHFTTPVPYDPQRTKNLVNGAKKLNGMLIRPGETFSLIEAFGPMTAENGYVESGVIVSGFSAMAMGGGLSQISTTLFNAAYEAGMEDVAHQPHSRYFERYPEGREATIYLPYLDMKWRNNTPYGVLIQAWIDDKTNIALWSTKYWDTTITTGPRTNFTPPTTVYNTDPKCIPEPGGQHGFSVHISRVVSKDGVRNEEYSGGYTHTYEPWNRVVCGEKPKPETKEKKEDKVEKEG